MSITTIKPQVTDTVTVIIKAVGPQGPDGVSTGDMTKAVYDPTTVAGDAFAMDSMVEGATTKILTATERTKLGTIQEYATVNDNAAQVKIKYETNADTNAYTDAEKAKLITIEESADVTADNETSHADVLVDSDIGFSVASISHNHTGVYEPVISKNTGFNKALGTTAGTVSEGDHLHSGVYEPADATILKTADIGVSIPALSHTHTESQISDLRAYLVAADVTYELLDTNGDVGTGAGQLAIGDHTHPRMTVFVSDIDPEIAASGWVPVSDGAGNVIWQAQVGATVTEEYVNETAVALAIALG